MNIFAKFLKYNTYYRKYTSFFARASVLSCKRQVQKNKKNKEKQLTVEYDDVVRNVILNERIEESTKTRYIKYLSDMRDLKTEYFKNIYDYFIKAV